MGEKKFEFQPNPEVSQYEKEEYERILGDLELRLETISFGQMMDFDHAAADESMVNKLLLLGPEELEEHIELLFDEETKQMNFAVELLIALKRKIENLGGDDRGDVVKH